MSNKEDTGGVDHGWSVPWIGVSVISGDWFEIYRDEAASIMAIMADYFETAGLPVFLAKAQVQRMRAMALTVYPDWLLVECQAQANSEAVVLFNFMFGPNGAILLDGRSDAIHALNRHLGVSIVDVQAAAEYLTFYCSAVRSGLGRFEIIASIADLSFAPRTTAAQKASVRHLLTTLRPGEADDRGVLFQGTVRYGASLFRTHFLVPANGHVRMLDDDELNFDAKLETELFEGPFRIPAARSR